jgi:hypothetical protein
LRILFGKQAGVLVKQGSYGGEITAADGVKKKLDFTHRNSAGSFLAGGIVQAK